MAPVILDMWRTSGWIGVGGLVAGYRQRHPNLLTARPHLCGTRATAGARLRVQAGQGPLPVRRGQHRPGPPPPPGSDYRAARRRFGSARIVHPGSSALNRTSEAIISQTGSEKIYPVISCRPRKSFLWAM
jgi:hypothetical protein